MSLSSPEEIRTAFQGGEWKVVCVFVKRKLSYFRQLRPSSHDEHHGTLNTSEKSNTVPIVGPSAVKKCKCKVKRLVSTFNIVSTSLIHGRFRTLPGRHRRAHCERPHGADLLGHGFGTPASSGTCSCAARHSEAPQRPHSHRVRTWAESLCWSGRPRQTSPSASPR